MPAAARFLATKLHPPSARPNRISRPRLLARLDEGRPLTLVAAPAGFGKTTLLSDWVRQNSKVAWLSLDDDDNDPARFWGYVVAALRQVEPAVGEAALAWLQSPPAPTVAVVSELINQLAALPERLVLVLDDYHVISAPPIHEALAYLLDHLPDPLRLVITTRADPPLPMARRRSRGQLTELRAADLRFTPDEAAAFLTQALGPWLSPQDIAALGARTEGWIVGLQLAALSLRGTSWLQGRPDGAGFVEAFTGSHRYIIDYLLEEVLARQPEPVQAFLLQTAILDRLEGSLCEAVLADPGAAVNGQAMLERLEQANLFLAPLDDERRWYRYHQLFAEALRHRLQHRQPDLARALHRRASAWYEQQGLPRDAVHHALAAADFDQAARLMEQAGSELVSQGEVATLQRWVNALPAEMVRSRLELAVWQGWLLFVSGQLEAAEQHLDDLERRFAIQPLPGSESSSQAETFGRVTAIRASLAIIRRDLPQAIALSRQALAYLPKDNLARAYPAWYLGKALWLSGDVEAACLALASAARVSWELGHRYVAFQATHDLAQLYVAQGQLHQADQTYRQALQQALEWGSPQPAFGPAYVGRGQLEREWNHLEAAAALFQQGLQLCQQAGNTPIVLQATLGLAFVKQAQGDAAGASALMRQALELAERHSVAQPGAARPVAAAQARLGLLQGDEAAAAGWAQRCGLSLDQELSHVREREVLTLVRVLIRQRQADVAARWLARLLRLARAQGRTGSEIEILMLQAEAAQAAGDQHQGQERLSQALALAEPEGYQCLFLDEGTPIARLLEGLPARPGRGQPGAAHYRDQLLALLGGAPGGDAAQPASPAAGLVLLGEPVSQRELEVLRLIGAGCSNQEIADRLVIALSTVKWYIHALYGKLQVDSRTKAIARARELNLL
jgi:LuxR family maltose regulon positive regulatory protein